MSVPLDESIARLSPGTFQQPAVQHATFGRLLCGRPDTLAIAHIGFERTD